MAMLQLVMDQQGNQDHGQSTGENSSFEAASASHFSCSSTPAVATEEAAAGRSAAVVSAELDVVTITGTSVNAAPKSRTAAVVGESAAAPLSMALGSPTSSAGSNVPGVNDGLLMTGGKDDQEQPTAGVSLPGSSKTTLVTETLTLPCSGERRDSVSSTCDDMPPFRTGQQQGSTCSSWISSSSTSDSQVGLLHCPLPSARPGLVGECFQSSSQSKSKSNSNTSINSSSSAGSTSSTGTTSNGNFLSDSTTTSSSGDKKKPDGCESISSKDHDIDNSDESHFGSSPYYRSPASSSTTNSSSSSSIESGTTTCGRARSSFCESTRISVDSTLLIFETNNPTSESSGSSVEEESLIKENRITDPSKPTQQQLLVEELQETGRALPPHEVPFSEDFANNVKGDKERGNSTDSSDNCQETTAKVSSSSTDAQHGTTTQHTPDSRNNVNARSTDGSWRRRSSSCSSGRTEGRGTSVPIQGHVRLRHADLWTEGEQGKKDNNNGDDRLTAELPEVFKELAAEGEKAFGTLSTKWSITGTGVSGSPSVFTAGSHAKSECYSPATTNNLFSEEIEYTSKKSCLGLERDSTLCGKEQLSTSPEQDTKTTSDPHFRNVSPGPHATTPAAAVNAAAVADIRVPAGGSQSTPVRRSSLRHRSASGGSSSSRTPSLAGVLRGMQQQSSPRLSYRSSVPEVVMPRSPARANNESTTTCEDDRILSPVREGAGGGTGIGGGGLIESSANGAKDSAVCKREDRWTSPFPGVKYCRSRNAWIARWSESGQEKWKTFPVKDSSFEEARRRALEFRQEKDRRKFERLWQQLNAEGLAVGNSGEAGNSQMSPGGGKVSGSDSSGGEGGAARNHAGLGGSKATKVVRSPPLSKDTKGPSAWQQQQQEGGGRHCEQIHEMSRLTRLSAYRSSILMYSTQRKQQQHQRKKQDPQQQQQLEELIRQQGVACDDSGRETVTKSTNYADRSTGSEGIDAAGSGLTWPTPCAYTDISASTCSGKDEDSSLSPGGNGWPQKNVGTPGFMPLQGTRGSNSFSTGSTNSLVSPESGWASAEDPLRRESSGTPKVADSAFCRGDVDSGVGKSETSSQECNGLFGRQQQQQLSAVNGLTWTSQVATTEGHEGLAGGRVVEALLRVLNGESADAMRKRGLSSEKIALLLGEHGLLPADAVAARVPAEEVPVCRKRRSRDEDTIYSGSEPTTTVEPSSPTSMKILSMYKAALLLIMDDLMSNGLPLLVASGGAPPLGADYRHLAQASAVDDDGKVQLVDRKALVEHSMRKMLEHQRKCIAEASLLGAVSPFVKLFETCILDQKLPSQADDSGRMQLVYLNALSALQELSLYVKNGNSIVW